MGLWFKRGDQLFEVDEGTPEHEQLVKLGAEPCDPDGKTGGDSGGDTGDLESLKVPQLRAIAKDRGIEGAAKLNKDELIAALTASDAPDGDEPSDDDDGDQDDDDGNGDGEEPASDPDGDAPAA